VARQIDRKLRLTAALLGIVGRKELAAAFRRVNAGTSFEVARADKWLQGRAQPRDLQVYEDWSTLLRLDRPGQWIADCDAEAFLDEICARHGRDREALQRDLEAFGKRPGLTSSIDLTGTFASYSHAWSINRGQLIRGELAIQAAAGQNRLRGTYTEVLGRDSRVEYSGPIVIGKRAMHFEARDSSGDSQFKFTLFQPSPPASVLGGLWSGATVLGPLALPSVTRVVMVRMPAASPRLRATDGFVPGDASLAEDLAALGLRVADPAAVDYHLREFLSDGPGGGFDQISAAAYQSLVELFDRSWFSQVESCSVQPARQELPHPRPTRPRAAPGLARRLRLGKR
jgi:hypothetical protein